MIIRLFCLLFFFLNILMASQFDELIPLPNDIQVKKGSFLINSKTKIVVFSLKKKDIDFIIKEVREQTGLPLKIETVDVKWGISNKRVYPGDIVIRPSIPNKKQIKGSYKLLIEKEIAISAGEREGILNALSTIRQLVYFGFDKEKKVVKIQKGKIIDSPKFGWRGMHLDVSRHFFTVEEIKKYLDYLFFYKYNIFHWHLVDDGGWRLEIKKYPKLTKLGGFRFGEKKGYSTSKLQFPQNEQQLKNNKTYGGYYTQEEVKEIIAYASKRGIEIIPEIELPGHNLPALDTHPELRCIGKNIDRIKVWGFNRQNSFCAGNEKSFEFLKNVLKEVIDLFPSKYIHIGADEVLRDFWNQCPLCLKRMLDEKIISQKTYEEYSKKAKVIMPILKGQTLVKKDKNLQKLQKYFVKRIIKYIHSNGKNVIGWDDGVTHWDKIEDSPLQKGDIIFYWRGNRNVEKAIENGIKVARMHMGSVYFDYNKGTYPPYNYDIIPKNLENNPYATNILGSQGCVWTERMNDFDRVEYMVFPRIASLAENLWTKNKNYDSFLKRINSHYPIWVFKGINFKLSPPKLDYNLIVFSDKDKKNIDFVINNPFAKVEGLDLKYSLNESTFRKIDNESFSLKNIISSSFIGKKSKINFFYSNNKEQESNKSILNILPKRSLVLDSLKDPKKGINVYYKSAKFRKVPNFNSVKNLNISVLNEVKIINKLRGENDFISFYRFYLEIKQDGDYIFSLGSDDGSVLKIGDNLVVDNDGPHGFQYAKANCRLVKGFYPVEIGFFELGGSEKIDFFVTKDGKKINLKYYQRN